MAVGGNNIEQIGEGAPSGSTFGGSATAKISHYGVTPVVQAANIAQLTASTATTTSIATALNSLLTVVQNQGFTAAS
jgi:hypothetical protein